MALGSTRYKSWFSKDAWKESHGGDTFTLMHFMYGDDRLSYNLLQNLYLGVHFTNYHVATIVETEFKDAIKT